MPRSANTESTTGKPVLPTLYSEKERRAKRSYRCFECHTKIDKGERYTNVTGKQNGNFRTYRFCNPCFNERRTIDPDESAAHQDDFRVVTIPGHWHFNAQARERWAGQWITLPTRQVQHFTRHVLGMLKGRGDDPMDHPRPPQRPTRWDHINWDSVQPA